LPGANGGATAGGAKAPSAPAGPTRPVSIGRTSITLSWDPSTGAVVAYQVYEYKRRTWLPVGGTTARVRAFVDARLGRRSRHRFEGRVVDAAGRASAPLVGRWLTTR
jgi:hypothetical protein